MATVLAVSGPALAARPPAAFEIRSTTLSTALMAFAEQAKIQVVMNDADLRGLSAQPLRGRYDPAEALRRLIGHAPVEVEWIGSSTIAVRAAQARLQPVAMTSQVAQDAATAPSTAIEEVVVTARRTEENLQEVPIAVTALSGDALAARGIGNVSALSAGVPGLFMGTGGAKGSASPVLAIRGQVNRIPDLTTDPSVGIYFAEVPWARPIGANAAFVDVDSVQVLKGPQGTLFGRNSTAGAILITPREPTDVFGGYVKITGGDFDLFGLEAVVNVPLNDELALRLAGSRQKRDGYLRDVVDGHKTDDVNEYTFRAALRWTPSPNTTSTTIFSLFDSDAVGHGSRLVALSPQSPSASVAPLYARFVQTLAQTRTLGRYEFPGPRNAQAAGVLQLGVPQLLTARQFSKAESQTWQNTTTFDLGESGFLGDASLKNIASFRRAAGSFSFGGAAAGTTAAPFLSADVVGDTDSRQFTEELQIQGVNGNLSYIFGGFYFQERGHDTTFQYAVVPILSITNNFIKNESVSAFGHISYDFGGVLDGLTFAAGGRINRDARYVDFRSRRQTTPGLIANPAYTCFLQPSVAPNNGDLCHYPVKSTFTEPTWDIGLSYKIPSNTMVYATIAHGYRAGGYNRTGLTASAVLPYKAETSLNYEIGSKSDFFIGEVPARLNLAAYYTDYKDIQRTISAVGPSGLVQSTFNAARAHITGFEGDFTLKPTRRLEFVLTYAYTRPKYDEFFDSYREPTNGVTYRIDASDSEFIFISRHAVSASASYRMPLDPRFGELVATADYSYRSGFFTTTDINGPSCAVPGNPNPAAIYVNCYNHASRLPGYGLVNARVDWKNVMGRGFDVGLFVRNLADKYYFPEALNGLASFGTFSVEVGPPRMFGVELRAPFGAAR